MVLSGRSIRRLMRSGGLVIDPLGEGQIQPASVDLRVAGEMLTAAGKEIDFGKEPEYERSDGEEIIIPPGKHALVRTVESIELPKDIGAITKLRSSASRIGLMFNNAGWVDPGFRGALTLSLYNSNQVPVRIKAGTRLFQLLLVKLDQESEGYMGKYSNRSAIMGSRAHRDRENNGEGSGKRRGKIPLK